MKRVEVVLNLDGGVGQVGLNERLVHWEHGVSDLIDDFARVLPDLHNRLNRMAMLCNRLDVGAHARDVPQHTLHQVEVNAACRRAIK